jgi:hypothetical protein
MCFNTDPLSIPPRPGRKCAVAPATVKKHFVLYQLLTVDERLGFAAFYIGMVPA